MGLEYEYRYSIFNKADIISNIKKNKGKKKGTYLFRVSVFEHPLKEENSYVRVRDEGFKVTMTVKHNIHKQFVDEDEVVIDDYDTGIKIFLGLGCKKLYSYEKIREIWTMGNTEVVFDTNPGRVDIMEVESATKKELLLMVKKLSLQDTPHDNFTDKDLYGVFGINFNKRKKGDINFKNVLKFLKPLVKKNMNEFMLMVSNQTKMYKKVTK